MALRVDDIEMHIVNGTTDGYILLLTRYRIGRYEYRGLSRTVDIDEREVLRRSEASQLLTSGREIVQRMILDISGKLISHLSRHKRVGDMLALKIIVQCHEIEPQLLWNDVNRSSTGQCGVHIHHAGIETIAGVGSHLVAWLQVIITLIPMAEADKITVHQLAALGHSRRAGGVEQDEEVGGSK